MATVMTVKGDNINDTADNVITFLKGASTGSVIFFHGWYGLGGSTTLKAVVKRLKGSPLSSGGTSTSMGSSWDKIIHIDCSLWKSKRVLQKEIAGELKLPQQVMAIFDQYDEEDDFEGVERGSRDVIPYVKWEIFKALNNQKFLVVFHNGSGSYIDLWEYGVPIFKSMSGIVLWTSSGRFQIGIGSVRLHFLRLRLQQQMRKMQGATISTTNTLLAGYSSKDSPLQPTLPITTLEEDDVDAELKKLAGLSDVALLIVQSSIVDEELVHRIVQHMLYEEAKEVASYTGLPQLVMRPTIVLECILYMALRSNDCSIDWGTHAPNYWVCDGIIEASVNGCGQAWEIANALEKNINLDLSKFAMDVICNHGKQWINSDRWVSASGFKEAAILVPSEVTSFFCSATGSAGTNNATLALEAGMFGPSNRSMLRVLHLSRCSFSFSIPPFQSCINLRFLLLDDCKDNDETDYCGEEKHQSNNSHRTGEQFWKLWVLDLRHTNWYWLLSEEMMDEMDELRELNVKGVTDWTISHLHQYSGAKKKRMLHKLRVTTEPSNIGVVSDIGQASQVEVLFPDLLCWSNLTKIVLNGCDELEKINPNVLPKSLESFSFTSNGNTKVKSISFRGCARLESVLLTGLFHSLLELDVSGTSLKILNLSAVQAPYLRRLFLLACGNLYAILWPQEGIELKVVHIDTATRILAREDKDIKDASCAKGVDGNRTNKIDSYISLRDARLLRSFQNVRFANALSVKISSASSGHEGVRQDFDSSAGRDQQVQDQKFYVNDNLSSQDVGAYTGVGNAPTQWMWPCPPIPTDRAHCYIIIQDEKQTNLVPHGTTRAELDISATIFPNFVHKRAEILHVHDCLEINCIPVLAPVAEDRDWFNLQWCRLERCPNLEGTVFLTPQHQFTNASIFSCLETFWASHLLKARYIWDWSTSWFQFQPGSSSFEDLKFLRLDFCPRLVHVLPLYASSSHACQRLEVLEIMCCGNLREVFPSDSELLHKEPREFPHLKRIHLYELPMLQKICGHRMSAPKLETVKIRGCWSLRHLPAVHNGGSASPPKVDCEKDWWDGLEWDGKEAGHHPSLYKPRYSSKHYRKTLLRRTVLR